MSAAGFLLIGGGLVLVYAGLTGDNPIAQLQRVLAGGPGGAAAGGVADAAGKGGRGASGRAPVKP